MKKEYFTLENKPTFQYNEFVYVDFGKMFNEGTVKGGRVVGIATENVIDNWIIQFEDFISEKYKFKALCVPHVFILKSLEVNY